MSPRLTIALLVIGLALVAFRPPSCPAAGISTIAGTGEAGAPSDGSPPAAESTINQPFGVIETGDGDILFCDTANHAVRRIDPDGRLSTIAGTGTAGYSGDGGPATQAMLNEPYEARIAPDGAVFVVERLNHTIRRIDARTGIITTIAGTGTAGYRGDGGPATEAELRQPHAIEFGPDGRLFVCDIGNHRVRVVDPATGTIDTFAGTGEPKTPSDGARINGTPLHGPRAMAFAPDGSLWLSLREGRMILRLDLVNDRIHHVAGTGRRGGGGDGGPALDAELTGPLGMTLSPADGNLYFCDTDNHSVRMLDLSAEPPTIHRIAGTGASGDGPDGDDPLACALARPHGIFATQDGRLLIGDTNNHRVRLLALKRNR